jgi:hypothetical protein
MKYEISANCNSFIYIRPTLGAYYNRSLLSPTLSELIVIFLYLVDFFRLALDCNYIINDIPHVGH